MLTEYWVVKGDAAHLISDLSITVSCKNGFVRLGPAHGPPHDLDTVMEKMGFKRVEGPGAPVYQDQKNRKMDGRITMRFPFPPTAIHIDDIDAALKKWAAGPDKGENAGDIFWM